MEAGIGQRRGPARRGPIYIGLESPEQERGALPHI
jgi:hypothetical protein